MYDFCGLRWNQRAKAVITAYSSAGNPKEVSSGDPGTIKRDSRAVIKVWRHRLTQEEIERVRVGTYGVASLFYDERELE